MAETLTVTVDDGGTYTVDVRGVDLFTDQGLTSAASFPASVSAQTTTWYTAAPAAHGRRPNIEVLVTASDGTQVPVDTIQSLPATVNLTEGSVDLSGPSSSGTSGAVPVLRTADCSAAAGDAVLADASGGDFSVTLPAPTSGVAVIVKNSGASGAVTVLPHGSETIDGAASNLLGSRNLSRNYLADGTNWWVV